MKIKLFELKWKKKVLHVAQSAGVGVKFTMPSANKRQKRKTHFKASLLQLLSLQRYNCKQLL